MTTNEENQIAYVDLLKRSIVTLSDLSKIDKVTIRKLESRIAELEAKVLELPSP